MATVMSILKAAVEQGKFPEVTYKHPENAPKNHLQHAKSLTGKVREIRESSISVYFEGMHYNVWFNEGTGDDKRKCYLNDLDILP